MVGRVKMESLNQNSDRVQGYFPFNQVPQGGMTVIIKGASDPNQLISSARNAVREIDPDQPIYSPRTMNEIRAESVQGERLTLTLLSLFAGIALVLAIVGIYGVMSYSVTQRTHEIGIRMAIGARPRDVFKMILGHGMKLALIGVGLGLLAAFFVTRFMATMLFGVEPTDATTFGAITAILIGVALLACYLPGRRATKVEPTISLRYEIITSVSVAQRNPKYESLNDLLYALRTLQKQPGFAAVVVITLALGIGASTAIFSVVNAVLLRPLPFPNSDRLHVIWGNYRALNIQRLPAKAAEYDDYAKQTQVFDSVAAYSNHSFNMSSGAEPERIRGATFPQISFRCSKHKQQLGRVFSAAEQQDRVVVLSDGFWQRRFAGDRNVINQSITLDDQNYTVIGIMPPWFQFPHASMAVSEGANRLTFGCR